VQNGDAEALLRQFAIYARTPSQSAMSHEAILAVERGVAALEPDYQKVIQLRYIEGCSIKETSVKLGRTEGATHMLIYRGLIALKSSLLGATASLE
jgi:DNA-directed RNA polymerase specialized sigma24 family protein